MSSTKPKIAFFDFASCEGCQLTVLDSLQNHADLLNAVEIVQFREAMSERNDDYQIALIEGSYTRPSDEVRLQAIRDQAEIVVALGACAHLGGVNAVRNAHRLEEIKSYVYGEKAEVYESASARPISDVIQVDAFIPGCPIDRDEFVRAVKSLLQGNLPDIPDYPVCVECKLRETGCVFLFGKTCLGPITRAGCGAICPSFGVGCEGCRGLIPNPNMASLREVLSENGLDEMSIQAKMGLFLTNQVATSDMEA